MTPPPGAPPNAVDRLFEGLSGGASRAGDDPALAVARGLAQAVRALVLALVLTAGFGVDVLWRRRLGERRCTLPAVLLHGVVIMLLTVPAALVAIGGFYVGAVGPARGIVGPAAALLVAGLFVYGAVANRRAVRARRRARVRWHSRFRGGPGFGLPEGVATERVLLPAATLTAAAWLLPLQPPLALYLAAGAAAGEVAYYLQRRRFLHRVLDLVDQGIENDRLAAALDGEGSGRTEGFTVPAPAVARVLLAGAPPGVDAVEPLPARGGAAGSGPAPATPPSSPPRP